MKVLFVCEGNVNRSQMAAALLKKLRPEIDVSSAGTLVPWRRQWRSISKIGKESIALMQELGIDMRSAKMHRLRPVMIKKADTVVLMGPTPGGPLPEFLERSPKLVKWNVPDPGYDQISYREARDMVVRLVNEFAGTLDLASRSPNSP